MPWDQGEHGLADGRPHCLVPGTLHLEDDGEDVAEDGGAAAVPALVVRLVHHREEDGDEALHGDGDSHVDTENQLLLFVNFPSLRLGGRNSIMFSGLCSPVASCEG